MDDNKVTIGGKEFTLEPMRFKRLKKVLPLSDTTGLSMEAALERMGQMIMITVGHEDLENSPEWLDNATVAEMQLFMKAVARVNGLILSGEAKAGNQ